MVPLGRRIKRHVKRVARWEPDVLVPLVVLLLALAWGAHLVRIFSARAPRVQCPPPPELLDRRGGGPSSHTDDSARAHDARACAEPCVCPMARGPLTGAETCARSLVTARPAPCVW